MKRSDYYRIALVLTTDSSVARDVMRGIIAAARERNMYQTRENDPRQMCWVLRLFSGAEYRSFNSFHKELMGWAPDGFIAQINFDKIAGIFRNQTKPVVELFESRDISEYPRDISEYPRILPDDVATGAMAAKYFLDRGFCNFAFSGMPSMRWSRERERGFKEAIIKAFGNNSRNAAQQFAYSSFNLQSQPPLRVVPRIFRSHEDESAQWLASLPKPVGLFACNDGCGSELIETARECGVRVPQDVAILGVDNDELLCDMCHPPLSSIRTIKMGYVAVDVLQKLLEGQSVSKDVPRVPPLDVITRQSTDVLAIEDQDVAEAVRFIHRHALEGAGVKQMLGSVSVNRRTLERRFAKILGHTPHEEIRRVRLEGAKVLLQTDLPIYQVAVRSGFGTPEYLATAFLQATGYSPTAYRQKYGLRSELEAMQ